MALENRDKVYSEAVSWLPKPWELEGLGSLCRYQSTDYVQQKKQYNQTTKPPGELLLAPLFLLWWSYLQKYLKSMSIVLSYMYTSAQ